MVTIIVFLNRKIYVISFIITYRVNILKLTVKFMNEKIKRQDLSVLFGRLVNAQCYSDYYAMTLKKCMVNYVIPFMEKMEYEYYGLSVGEEFFSIYSKRNKHFTITSRRTVLLLRFYTKTPVKGS